MEVLMNSRGFSKSSLLIFIILSSLEGRLRIVLFSFSFDTGESEKNLLFEKITS